MAAPSNLQMDTDISFHMCVTFVQSDVVQVHVHVNPVQPMPSHLHHTYVVSISFNDHFHLKVHFLHDTFDPKIARNSELLLATPTLLNSELPFLTRSRFRESS